MIDKMTVPWQLKMIIKIILSNLPVNYHLWQKIGIFKHGDMSNPEYVFKVFNKHFERSHLSNKTFTALELGPGDSLLSSVIAFYKGAKKTYLVDSGRYANFNQKSYERLVKILCKNDIQFKKDYKPKNNSDLLKFFNGIYLTDGVHSLKQIPDNSVDFIWSQAVLEHIPRAEVSLLNSEFFRILSPSGVCSHRIDLKDHLSGRLNHLRFSESFWESDMIKKSGFYTNRLRLSEYMDYFNTSGFKHELKNKDKWNDLPIPSKKLNYIFHSFSKTDLKVSGFDVVLYKN